MPHPSETGKRPGEGQGGLRPEDKRVISLRQQLLLKLVEGDYPESLETVQRAVALTTPYEAHENPADDPERTFVLYILGDLGELGDEVVDTLKLALLGHTIDKAGENID